MTRTAVGITAFVVALLLLAAGGLAIAGSRYISGNVHDELAAQKIAFAPAGSPGLPADIQSYGGKAVTNGADAKVFANQYISAHIGESIAAAATTDPRIKGMTTYSELSGLARTDPKNQSLSALFTPSSAGRCCAARCSPPGAGTPWPRSCTPRRSSPSARRCC